MYEMLSGWPPFTNKDRKKLFKKITTKPIKPKSGFSVHARHLIGILTQIDPKRRLADPELIKEHKFFEDIDWDKLSRKEIEPPFRPKLGSDIDTRNFEKKVTK